MLQRLRNKVISLDHLNQSYNSQTNTSSYKNENSDQFEYVYQTHHIDLRAETRTDQDLKTQNPEKM